ncbi:MAG: hypothetical protein NZL95_03340 [Chitinophagales bacterium]|nr:hypothetical protein [Chitinophagales bacterium]MDW8427565.1 hypothetical protein [Chitinophagales bacterium]
MHTFAMLLVSLIAGAIMLVAGIIVFSGKWGTHSWEISIGSYRVNYEGIGFVLFFLGIVLMLVYLIAKVKPALLSPGLSG